MKSTTILFLVGIFLFACSAPNKHAVEVEYYRKALDFRFYDYPDSIIKNAEAYYSRPFSDSLKGSNRHIHEQLHDLVMHGLLRKPYVNVMMENEERSLLFLDKPDFDKVNDFIDPLDLNEYRVRIEAEADSVPMGSMKVLVVRKFISMKKIVGRTHFEK